jgi:cystathionine beta-lyase/cystathionine gamma-synthase
MLRWINMKKKEINSSRIPLYRDAGFELYDASVTSEAFKKEADNKREPDLYIYSRYRNPTVVAAEEEIMKIEGCDWALLTQSGMSAIDTVVSIFQYGKATKPWLFFSEIYGGTISYVESVLKKRRGIDIHTFLPDNEKYDPVKFENTIKTLKPEFVYIEAISNPMLIVPDADKLIRIAGKYSCRVIVDNTFATPVLWKPLESGADIVIYSATKYFSGHGNLTAGVLCGNDTGIMKAAIEYRKLIGHMISPDDAYRLHTQIQSFELRFRQQCSNADRISQMLNQMPGIGKVRFPGLQVHPTHSEAVRLFASKGFGAMITFDFDGKDENEKRLRRDNFIQAVSDKIKLIPSLGDSRTILMPVEAVWGAKYPEPGMIRLSIGFENYEEIRAAIEHGISTAL